MRIWTTQTVLFWNQLQEQGVVWCDTAKSWGAADMKDAYDWMVGQMTKRIGPPPRPEIQYPIWGWYQVGSHKKELHPNFYDCSGDDDEFVFITANIPEDKVLLSDFDMWHFVLNHWYLPVNKHDKEKGKVSIVRSWDLIFDLGRRVWGFPLRRNKQIQATFWELRKEWVVREQRIKGYQEWLRKETERKMAPL